ncbi:DNA-binding transcriptional ArsR family regulator [Novosphingobium sp. SG751A]|uniref:hypothetical protein n=1 Tax=Novosphingobium sp. SG751A TaxID=2587000 RepID=UPI0015521EE2|nr:hypothetical protein [Novosphingobium sp. SG751A]NOW47072.1 DNA-binding transcriptional ArsR family regulator [Novosphingobium sp. SG751A]
MQSLRFPWSLTHIARMPHPDISRVADEFLAAGGETGKQDGAMARRHTLATYRLVIRLLTEMQLQGVVALARLVDQDYLGGNALVALLAEAGRLRPEALESSACLLDRPITIRAMARSFRRPYETMRRALHRLSELGLVDLREDGVVLAQGVVERAEIRAYLSHMHDIMVTFLEDLFVFARLPVPEMLRSDPAMADHRQRLIKLAALDLHLLSVEGMQGIFSDWTGLLLAAAITAGNIRDVTYHPQLAFTYAAADSIPPMELRRPVLFRTLCDTLPLCPTTAWRRIAVMKMLGSIRTIDGGLILDSKWLGHPALIANACERIERMHAIINRMVQSGVALDAIGDLYIRGRVDPIDL